MRNDVSDILQAQLQKAFVKSGMTTKQFYEFIVVNRADRIFDNYIDTYTFTDESNLPYYKFNSFIDNEIVTFYCVEGSEWGCKF